MSWKRSKEVSAGIEIKFNPNAPKPVITRKPRDPPPPRPPTPPPILTDEQKLRMKQKQAEAMAKLAAKKALQTKRKRKRTEGELSTGIKCPICLDKCELSNKTWGTTQCGHVLCQPCFEKLQKDTSACCECTKPMGAFIPVFALTRLSEHGIR